MASPGSGSYQQSGPSAPQTARAVLYSAPSQQKGFGDLPARLVTNFPRANSNLVFQARASGVGGEAITVAIVVAGNNTAQSISVSTNAITINAATDATGNSVSTAAAIRDAINTTTASSALIAAALAEGDGSGVVGALTATALAGDALATHGQDGNAPLPAQHPTKNVYA